MKKRKKLYLDFEIRKLTSAILKGGYSIGPEPPRREMCVSCGPLSGASTPSDVCRCWGNLPTR